MKTLLALTAVLLLCGTADAQFRRSSGTCANGSCAVPSAQVAVPAQPKAGAAPVKKAAPCPCPCPCGCGVTGVCTCGASVQAAPVARPQAVVSTATVRQRVRVRERVQVQSVRQGCR